MDKLVASWFHSPGNRLAQTNMDVKFLTSCGAIK